MNVYEEMLEKRHKANGLEFDIFSKEKNLEELLSRMSKYEKVNDKYGIDLNSKIFSIHYITNDDEFTASVNMSGGRGYLGMISEISNSDKQPKAPEMMFYISHPTGAYIFGDYYPVDFFNEFFKELKEKTNPEYTDEVNHCLYYPAERTMQVLAIYDDVYKVYQERNKENYRQEMIKRKKAELEALKKGKVVDNVWKSSDCEWNREKR